jgi:hypothetical protein
LYRTKLEGKTVNDYTQDIPLDVARRAHEGSSFTPERRAASEQADYSNHMNAVREEFLAAASCDESMAEAERLFEKYRTGYKERSLAYLYASSRVMSTMITGPANFPVRRMQKRGDTMHKRLTELLDWSKKSQAWMLKEIRKADPAYVPESISSDRSDAVELLQKKLTACEQLQERMKAGNKIVRAKLSDEEKVIGLMELGLAEVNARKALLPDFCGRVGFPDYALTNNNAEIRRIKLRIEQLQRNATKETAENTTAAGIRVVENREDNRLQLFFPDKPAESIRSILKRHGFRWAPSIGAWQRQLTSNAKDALQYVLKQIEPVAA